VRDEGEERASELLRSWLTAEQVAQLDSSGAFAVVVERLLLVLVPGTHMVYEPGRQKSYGWYPYQPGQYPPSDELLCQALALGTPGGLGEMLYHACQWPRDQTSSAFVRGDGPAWTAVDRLVARFPGQAMTGPPLPRPPRPFRF
jgi:hypothetical protein